jgi:hypothetical protein
MNDWYNDPPDEPADEDPSLVSSSELYDTLEEYCMDHEPVEYERTLPEKCPHGNEWGSCDRCDHEGDLAYDTWREKH